jgi:hypothetical protein
LLTRLLGDYVEDGLDAANLKVGIWAGKVELEKLKLRRDAFDALDLPLAVAHGFIGSVLVTVPWSNLKQQPVIVAVRDVHVVLRPRSVVARDRDDARRRAAQRKRARLDAHDDALSGSAAAAPSEETFLSKLLTKILDNVQVTIDGVHVRFEDDLSDAAHPFACGLTLQRITAQSCNDAWQPAFVATDVDAVRKRFELIGCAVYWACDAADEFVHSQSPARVSAFLAASIAAASRTDYIVQPVRATLRVLLSKRGVADERVPLQTLDFLFERIDVSLLDRQYRDASSLLDWAARAARRERYCIFRPAASDGSDRTPTPREQPRQWWQFAIAAVRSDVRERLSSARWNLLSAFLVQRGNRRRRYVALYSQKLTGRLVVAAPPAASSSEPLPSSSSSSSSSSSLASPPLPVPSLSSSSLASLASVQSALAELFQLEDELPYDDVVFFRSMARAICEPQQKLLAQQRQQAAAQSWVDWAWSWSGASASSAAATAAAAAAAAAVAKPLPDKQALDESSRRAFFEAIEFDPHAHQQTPSTRVVQLKVRLVICDGSLTICRSETRPLGAPTASPLLRDLVSVDFGRLVVAVDQRLSSAKFSVSLMSLQVRDCYTLNTCFPRLVVPLKVTTATTSALRVVSQVATEFEPLTGALEEREDGDDQRSSDTERPFFEATVDTGSTRADANLYIVVRMQPSELVYNPYCVDALLAVFASVPSDAFAPLSGAAQEKFDETARRMLEDLEQQDLAFIDVQLAAPTIVLPQTFQTSTTTLLVVDLGLLSIATNPPTQRDGVRVDSFAMGLSRLQLFLVDCDNRKPASGSGSVVTQRVGRRRPLVDRFDVLFDVERRPDMTARDLPQWLVVGSLPRVRVEIGPREYDELLGVLDRALSTMGSGPPVDAVAAATAAAATAAAAAPVSLHELIRDQSAELRAQLARRGLSPAASPLLIELRVSVGIFECVLAHDRVPRSQSSGAGIIGDDSLLRLTLRNLAAGAKVAATETTAFVSLEHIAVLDCVQSVLHATPCYVLAPQQRNDADALMVSFTLFERDALTRAEQLGAAMALDVAFDALALSFDRETLVQLINVLLAIDSTHERWASMRTMRSKAALRRSAAVPLAPKAALLMRASSPVAPEDQQQSQQPQQQRQHAAVSEAESDLARWRACDVLRVCATLRAVDLRFNCGAESMAILSLSSADLNVRIAQGRAPSLMPVVRSVHGTIGAVTLVDMRQTARDADRSCGQTVVDIDGKYTVDFLYEHRHVPRAERVTADRRVIAPESIRVRMSAIQLALRLAFFVDFAEYFAELGRMNDVLRRTVTAAADAALDVAAELITDSKRPVGYLHYALRIAAPRIVVLGRTATLHRSACSLTAQLGNFTLSNRFELVGDGKQLLCESVLLHITAMNVRTSHGSGAAAREHQLISDIDIAVRLVMSPLPTEPVYRVTCTVTPVDVFANDAQFELARAVIETHMPVLSGIATSSGTGATSSATAAPAAPLPAQQKRSASTPRARGSTLSAAMLAQLGGDAGGAATAATAFGGTGGRVFVRAHGSVARVSVALFSGGVGSAATAPLASFTIDSFKAVYAMPQRGLVYQQAILTIESLTVRDERADAPQDEYRNLLYCGGDGARRPLGDDGDEPDEAASPLLLVWTTHSDVALPVIVRVRIERPCALLMSGALLALSAYAHRQLAVLSGVSRDRVTPSILRGGKTSGGAGGAAQAPQQQSMASALRLECVLIEPELGLLEDAHSLESRSIVMRGTVLLSVGVGAAAAPSETTPMSVRVRMQNFEVFKSTVSRPTERVSIVQSVDASLEYASLFVGGAGVSSLWGDDDELPFASQSGDSTELRAQLHVRVGALRVAFSYTDFQLSLRIVQRYAATLASISGVVGSPDALPLVPVAALDESVAANWRWHSLVQQQHRQTGAAAAPRDGLALLVGDSPAAAAPRASMPLRAARSTAMLLAKQLSASASAPLLHSNSAPPPASAPAAAATPPKPPLPLFVSAVCHAVRVTLIHDAAGRNVPLLDASIAAVRADAKSAAEKLDLTLEALAKVDYYNSRLSVWEPLVEQWAARMVVEQAGNTRVVISSPDVLNVNVTAACADAVLDFYTDLSREQAAASGGSSSALSSMRRRSSASSSGDVLGDSTESSPGSSPPPARPLSTAAVVTSATTEASEVDAFFNQLAVRFASDRQVQAMRSADELTLCITETVRKMPATAFRSQLFAEIESRTQTMWRALRRAHASHRHSLSSVVAPRTASAIVASANIFRPYVLRNFCGVEVVFSEMALANSGADSLRASLSSSPAAATAIDDAALKRTLSDGASTALFVDEDDAVRARVAGEVQSALATHRISFRLDGFEAVADFPVDRVGVFVLPLRAQSGGGVRRATQQQVVCEVQFASGSKVTTLRSNVVLRNDTEHALELFVAAAQQPASVQSVRQVVLECGDTYCVPLSLSARSRVALRVYDAANPTVALQAIDAKAAVLSNGVSLPWLTLDASRLSPRTVILPSDDRFFACVCNPPRGSSADATSSAATESALRAVSADAAAPQRLVDEADHVVVIRPPLVVENVLACDAQFMVERVARAPDAADSRVCVLDRLLKCGEAAHVYAVDTSRCLLELKVRVPGYRWSTPATIDPLASVAAPPRNVAPLGDDGSGAATVVIDRFDGSSLTAPPPLPPAPHTSDAARIESMPTLRLTESSRPTLLLHIDAQRVCDTRSSTDWSVTPFKVTVFAQYWLVNRTSNLLRYANESSVRSMSPAEALDRSWVSEPALLRRNASTSRAANAAASDDGVASAAQNRGTTVMFSYDVGGADAADDADDIGTTARARGFSSSRACVRIEESRWSRAVSFESPGTIGALEIPNGASARVPSLVYELGYTVDVAPGAFFRTKLIQFTPRFMVHNSSRSVVLLRQRSLNETALTLLPGERRALHWPDVSAPLEAELCLRDATGWSRPVALDRAGDVATFAPLLIGIGIDDHGLPATLGRGAQHVSKADVYLIGLRVRFNVATFEVEVHDLAQRLPPYRLENCTQLTLHVYQDLIDSFIVPLKPYESRAFTWDEHVAAHCVRFRIVGAPYDAQFKSPLVKLDKLGMYEDIELGGDATSPPVALRLQVYCDGATRVLRVTDVRRHAPDLTREESFRRVRERASASDGNSASPATAAEPQEAPARGVRVTPSVVDFGSLPEQQQQSQDVPRLRASSGGELPPTMDEMLKEVQDGGAEDDVDSASKASDFLSKELGTFEVSIELAAIGVSLVDHVPQELMYLSLKKMRLAYTETLFDQALECTVSEMQCDNQMHAAPFPVLFAPAARDADQLDLLHFSVVCSKQHTKIVYIKYLSALLRECDLCVDELFLLAISRVLQRYATAFQPPPPIVSSDSTGGADDVPSDVGAAAAAAAAATADAQSFATSDMQVVYIKLLHLNPVKIYVSFQAAGGAWRAAVSGGQSSVAAAARVGGRGGPSIVSSLLTALAVGANVDRAPLQLNALFLKNAFATQSDLVSRITKHYSFQVISQLYIILGSFDIIGNPVSLVSTLGTGVYDFFYEPANALVRSPLDFGVGLMKGTSSLVKHTVYGLFDTASKITGSVGMGAAYLSGDHRYVRERGRRVAQRANNVGEGFYLGMRELGSGLLNGVRGVFVQPFVDARRDGAVGLLRGVVKGVIGAAIKPTVGLIDFGTRITQGVKNQVRGDGGRPSERVRRARHFGGDGRLEAYSAHHALGRWLLLSVIEQRPKNARGLVADAAAASASAESYVHHVDMQHGTVLLSNRRLLKVERQRLRVLWEVPLHQIDGIEPTRVAALGSSSAPPAASPAPDLSLRARFDYHFGLSDDIDSDRVLPSETGFGRGAVATAIATAAAAAAAAADEAAELTDDGAQDEIAPATPRPADAGAFEWVLVVRVRVAGDATAAAATSDGDGGAAAQVAEKRIVFGDEQQQMSLLSKLIVETIQIDQLRVRV